MKSNAVALECTCFGGNAGTPLVAHDVFQMPAYPCKEQRAAAVLCDNLGLAKDLSPGACIEPNRVKGVKHLRGQQSRVVVVQAVAVVVNAVA